MARGYTVVIRAPQGRRSPAEGTADLTVDGVAYDIYCPRTANVERIVSAVASKGEQAYDVVLDLSETKVTASQVSDILPRVQRTGSRLQDVIIVSE